MPIINTHDFHVIVKVLGSKANTHFVKNIYLLLTKFCLQHSYNINIQNGTKLAWFDPNLALYPYQTALPFSGGITHGTTWVNNYSGWDSPMFRLKSG